MAENDQQVQEQSAPHKPSVKLNDSIVTNDVHLATFLATLECDPQQILKGPERTNYGPVTKWVYGNNGIAEEIYILWSKANANPSERKDFGPGWETWEPEKKEFAVALLAAYTNNLRHFLAEAKRG